MQEDKNPGSVDPKTISQTDNNNVTAGTKPCKHGKRRKPRNPKGGKDGSRTRTAKPNDASWYKMSDAVTQAVASVPSYNRTGDPVRVPVSTVIGTGDASSIVIAQSKLQPSPGVLSLRFAPTVGNSSSDMSPVNIFASQVYAFIVHGNSRNTTYQKSDYACYLLAAIDAYAMLANAIRILTVARNYAMLNKYTPLGLLKSIISWKAGSVDKFLNDLQSRLPNYTYRINVLIAKLQALAIPSNFSYIQRRLWMNFNIFKENESQQSQFYLYKQVYYFRFNSTSSTGSALDYTNPFVATGAATFDTMLDRIDKVITDLRADDDIGLMSGDTLKAYGADSLMKFDPVYITTITEALPNDEVKWQFKNAHTVGWNENISDISEIITQSDNVLISDYFKLFNITSANNIPAAGSTMPGAAILRFKDVTANTPDNVLVYSRDVSMFTFKQTSAGVVYSDIICGSEIFLDACVVTLNSTLERNDTAFYSTFKEYTITGDLPEGKFYPAIDWNDLCLYFNLSKLSMAPIHIEYIYTAETLDPNKVFEQSAIFGNVDTHSYVPVDIIKQLHESSLLAMFSVPQTGIYGLGTGQKYTDSKSR